MKNFTRLLVILTALSISAPASAGLLDTKKRSGGSARIIVTNEQMVDAIKGDWEPHGFVTRYINRKEGVLIGEAPYFPLMSRYFKFGIPPEEVLDFSVGKNLQLSTNTGATNAPVSTDAVDSSAKEETEPWFPTTMVLYCLVAMLAIAATIYAKRRLTYCTRKNIDLRFMAAGLVAIGAFTYSWLALESTFLTKEIVVPTPEVSASANTEEGAEGEVVAALEEPEEVVKEIKKAIGADVQWYTCNEANALKADSKKIANKHYKPSKPMSCLIKVSFDKDHKKRVYMNVTLAALQDVPNGAALLMSEYGFRKQDAIRFSQTAPMVINSPHLREGLIDVLRRIGNDGQTIIIEESSDTSTTWRIVYGIGGTLTAVAWGWVLIYWIGLIVWNVKQTKQWGTVAKVTYGILTITPVIFFFFFPSLILVFFGLSLAGFIVPILFFRGHDSDMAESTG